MRRVLSAELAEFVTFQPVRIVFLVFHGRVVSLFAERTRHVDDFAHLILLDTNRRDRSPAGTDIFVSALTSPLAASYARISVTTPEPTVLPPSRTANRNP
jgi:hypothetical protein